MSVSTTYPSLPGIYKFTSLLDGKVYIGKSVSLKERLRKYRKPSSEDTHIFRAIKKHGIQNFSISILEIYPNRNHFIEKYILIREAFWIKFYDATNKTKGFNVLSFSTDRTGIRASKETKIKMSKTQKEKRWTPEMRAKMREKMSGDKNPCFGKKWSKERKEKHPVKRGKDHFCYGKPRSEETKQKISKGLSGKNHPNFGKKLPQKWCDALSKSSKRKTCQIDPQTKETVKTWDSVGEAALGVYGDIKRLPDISRAVHNGRVYRGFLWGRVKS